MKQFDIKGFHFRTMMCQHFNLQLLKYMYVKISKDKYPIKAKFSLILKMQLNRCISKAFT